MNYKKEYNKYLIASMLDTANNRIASTSFLTAFAVYLGLSDMAIGIYAVLDTITNILQILAAPLFSRIGQSKKVVLTNYTIYRISSICFAFIPFLSKDIGTRTLWFFLFAIIYAVTGELGYITFVNWRMTLLKKEDRTKFAATRNILKNSLVMVFSLTMGIVLDKFTMLGYELIGFLILFFIVFVIATIDILIRIRTYKPEIENKKIKIIDSVKLPAKDKNFRKILVTCALMRFGYGIGMMYLNVFLLRYLKISYLYYSILNLLIHLTEAITSKFWAKQAKQRDWKKVMLPMSIVYIIVFTFLFTFPNEILVYMLPIIYLLIGVGNGAYEIFDHIAIYENSKVGFETSFVTFERFIEGIITTLIPLLSCTLLSENGQGIKATFFIAIVSYIILFFYFKCQFRKTKNIE